MNKNKIRKKYNRLYQKMYRLNLRKDNKKNKINLISNKS